MKKLVTLAILLPAIAASFVISANVFAEGPTTGATTSSVILPVPPIPGPGSGFVQFNNLTVVSVSATNVPAVITASVSGPIPYAGVSGGGTGGVGPNACIRFNTQNDSQGSLIPCPTPSVNSGGAAIMPGVISYQIQISANTELMLRDRSAATLADFSQGDQINVFGYYNTDGSIQALLVRDISKPVQSETIQLNNVTLNSISTTNIPATLTVVQTQTAPCYGFNSNIQQKIACPMGVSSFSQNSATANTTPLSSLAPNWMMLRKYVVNVDARTIILDRNRTQLSLASLNLGDTLNIYGETNDNGQTITADIIRDLSIPATPSTYSGKITQVNADGSFVILTSDGQTFTVQSPISIGAVVTVRGLLNSNTISQVSSLNFNGDVAPNAGPMLLRTVN